MKNIVKYLINFALGLLPYHSFKKFNNIAIQKSLKKDLRYFSSIGLNIACVFDIGANKANWALDCSKVFKNVEFFLFEANKTNEEYLKRSGFKYFICVLSDKRKAVEFFSSGGTGDSYYKENTKAYDKVVSKTVEATILDDLVKEHAVKLPDFIKVDTQGSELDILRGGEKCVENAKLVLLECPIYPYNNGAPVLSEYIDFMLERNFYPYSLTEMHNLKGVLIQIDILFVKSDVLRICNSEFASFYLRGDLKD